MFVCEGAKQIIKISRKEQSTILNFIIGILLLKNAHIKEYAHDLI